jgi:hypothetical protein
MQYYPRIGALVVNSYNNSVYGKENSVSIGYR